MVPFQDARVAAVFSAYPAAMRARLFGLRAEIFSSAAADPRIGPLEETLKWGEPAYLTAKTGAGSLVRLDSWKKSPTRYAAYFHCQTDLVETFREMFGDKLECEGNRAVIFDITRPEPPADILRMCLSLALTYKLRKAPAKGRILACD